MKRALLIAGLAAGFARTLPAQTVTARLGGEVTGVAGAQISLPVVADMRASGGQRLGSYTARVAWPTRVLSYCYGCTDDASYAGFAPPVINADSAYYGVLRFSAAAPQGADGEVLLARLIFTVAFDSAATLGLSFSEMSASGSFANLLPLLTAQGSQYCPARGRYGDLNEDGRANSLDALITLSYAVGLPVDTTMVPDVGVGDVNADGAVTSVDALVVLSYAVGLEIPGQRVLVFAPSACASGSARNMVMLPDTAQLVPGQPVRAVVSATDSAGRPVALTNLTWRSLDPNVAFVESNGEVVARAAGSTDIIAEAGPGLRAVMRVNVVPRRTNWYVSLSAIGNPVQFGTVARPYERPADALRYVTEGDTVRIAPGTYRIDDDADVYQGAIVIGGTPGDTTTRPVLYDDSDNTIFDVYGGDRLEIHNVVFQNPYYAIEIDALRNLVLRDVRMSWGRDSYGYAIYHCGDRFTDTVRIENSVFEGDSTDPSGYGIYVSGCVTPKSVGVMSIRDSRFRWMYEGVYVYDVDSLHIERTLFEGIDDDAVYAGSEYTAGGSAIVMRRSRIVNSDGGIGGYDLRRVTIDSSYIETRSYDAISIEGACCGAELRAGAPRASLQLLGGLRATIQHDTVVLSGSYYDDWLDVYDADSLDVSDVLVMGQPDSNVAIGSYFSDVGWARFRRVQITNAGSGSEPFRGWNVGNFMVDSVSVTACPMPACWGAYGVVSGGSLPRMTTVTRSTFTNIAYGFQGTGSYGLYDIRNVVLDSTYQGIYLDNADSANVTDNVLRGITYMGINLSDQQGTRGPAVIARDSVSCSGGSYGLNIQYAGAVVSDNFVAGCTSNGIQAYLIRPGTVFRGNTLRLNYYGFSVSGDTTPVVLDSNAVTQSTIGVYVSGHRLQARRNNIRSNSQYGIYLYTYANRVHRVDSSAFQGNLLGAIVASSYDSVDATRNWWGVDGQLPGSPGAETVSGPVNASNPLAAEPVVPPPAPPAMRGPVAAAPAPVAPRPAAAPAPVSRQRGPATLRLPADPAERAAAVEKQARLTQRLAERERRRQAGEARQRQP